MYNEMTVKFYNQTGFNAIDIPESPRMLDEKFTPFKTITNANIIQNEFLAYIIVDDFTPEDARKIDYVVVENPTPTIRNTSCYTIDSFEFLADGTCKFNLYIDAYNTLGGFDINSGNQILGGSAKRMSISLEEDNTNFYTLEEPFIPSEKYRTEFQSLGINPSANAIEQFIEVITIPPQVVKNLVKDTDTDFGNKIKMALNAIKPFNPLAYMGAKIGEYVIKEKIVSDSGEVESANYNTMIIPQMRELLTTTVKLTKADNTQENVRTHTRYFLASAIKNKATVDSGEEVKSDLITDMRAAGRDNDIINYWEIPLIYINGCEPGFTSEGIKYKLDQPETYGGIENITSALTKANITITPTATFNNKARYKQSIEVKVFCSASGEQINKELYEVLATGTSPKSQAFNVAGSILADIRPQGTPIFLFDYSNQVSQIDNYCEHIKGANWRNIPLAASGISGENIYRAENETEKRLGMLGSIGELGLGVAQLIMGGVLTYGSGGTLTPFTAGMFASGAKSVMGGAISGFNTNAKFKEQEYLLNQKGVNASSQIQLGNSSFVRDIRKNVFTALITYYSQEDMVAYDTFLTRFGYNVGNKIIKQTDFFSRTAFNFIQINDITIESVLGDINLIDLTKKQLKQGVRIWHKKPNYNDMLAGGNR